MDKDWQLLRCVCGNAFGSKAGVSGRCTRCGSIRFRLLSVFDNPSELAGAVSNANLPKELTKEITSRISSREKILEKMGSTSNTTRSRILRAMHDATDNGGSLSIELLAKELTKIGIEDPTPEYLIGQAEIEGMLIRDGPDSWSWLQQSS